MSEHLTAVTLGALFDGELSAAEMASANEHLANCQACSSNALATAMLKASVGKTGRRYAMPPQLLARMSAEARSGQVPTEGSMVGAGRAAGGSIRPFRGLMWAAAALVLVCAGVVGMQYRAQRAAVASSNLAALVTEVSDEHIAALADSSQLQVLSSDRHTVKPWFQGKLPFSFNLPEGLPGDTALDGADLTYLHGQPAAQLLYWIGKHRVSVFLVTNGDGDRKISAEHAGFHVDEFTTENLDVIAVSDVDPARLSDLVARVAQAQDGGEGTAK